jgi:hypothetical protein
MISAAAVSTDREPTTMPNRAIANVPSYRWGVGTDQFSSCNPLFDIEEELGERHAAELF